MVKLQKIGHPAFEILNPDGQGGVVLICEHASPHIPGCYAGLGLASEESLSHAVWDPGARDLGALLSAALDAPMIAGTVSRLVYDCNRPPEALSAIPDQSERISVPGNRGLTAADRAARVRQVYDPFSAAVSKVIDAAPKDAVVVTVHSFTPIFHGQPRQTEIGLLHDADSRLVDAMLAEAKVLPHRVVARNEPYGPEDGVTHSLQRHAIARGLANVMIEVRNDLLKEPAQVATMASEILLLLRPALKNLQPTEAEQCPKS